MKVNITPTDKQIIGLNIQGNQQLSEAPSDLAKSTTKIAASLFLDTSINEMLKQLTEGLNQREKLLNRLPTSIKEAASQLITQNLSSQEVVPQGLSRLINVQKSVVTGLQNIESSISDAIIIKSQAPQNLSDLLQTVDQLLMALSDNDQVLNKALSSNNPKLITELPPSKTIFQQSSPLLANQEITEKHEVLLNVQRMLSQLLPEAYQTQDQKLSTLPDLIKLHNTLQLTHLDADKLLKAKETLIELTKSMQKSSALSDETARQATSQKTLSLTLPLYFENNPQPYPAYIHIYHEQKEENGNNNTGQTETWLRICLATENIGFVDLTFKLYQENLVNVNVAFDSTNASSMFAEYIPEIKSDFEESPLTLEDINVK